MTKSVEGISIDAEAHDSAGQLTYRIEANEFNLVPGQYSYAKRPDRSTLAVYDRTGREQFFVRYLNPAALRVRGIFFCAGTAPVTIRDDDIIGTNMFSHGCIGMRSGTIGFQFN